MLMLVCLGIVNSFIKLLLMGQRETVTATAAC